MYKQRAIDANDINMRFSDSNDIRPAIKNIKKEFKVDKVIKLFDL